MTKPLPDFETWGPMWQRNGWNNCFAHAADALDYLTKYDQPIGGEQWYNAMDLEHTAHDIRRSLEAMENYRKRMLDKAASAS